MTDNTFGTHPKKLVRADAIDTSKIAALTVNTTVLEEQVYKAVVSYGNTGCIQDQVLALPQFSGMPYSSVTARFRSLLDKRLIEDTGERRPGKSGRTQRVIRVLAP